MSIRHTAIALALACLAAPALAATAPRFRGQAVTVEHQHARPVRPVREVRP